VNPITITAERPDTVAARQLLSELDAYLLALPYPAESRHAFPVEKLLREQVAFFVTRYDDELAGCGGIKFYPDYGEVKRMYVRPSHRGHGLGKAMLDHLAASAQQKGVGVLRLETGIYQVEAIRLYERYGFQRRTPFSEYQISPMNLYFEKPV
jgi:ribosomal protein S18 acetylase RimI-like enzyme